MSLLLSSSSSILGLLSVTASVTGICRRRQAGSYVSFNLEFTPPASCCRPFVEADAAAGGRHSRAARRVAKAEAGPHASASHAAAAAAAAAVRRPLRHSLRRRGRRAMSLSNLRQLLMGAFCSTTDGIEPTGHCQESIQVSRNLSLKFNSYLSQRLKREYPVNAHRPSQPFHENLKVDYSFRPRATPVIHMMIMRKDRIVEYSNMSLRSDLTCVAQIEKILVFCKPKSKLNVDGKAESTLYTKILPRHKLYSPYPEKTLQ